MVRTAARANRRVTRNSLVSLKTFSADSTRRARLEHSRKNDLAKRLPSCTAKKRTQARKLKHLKHRVLAGGGGTRYVQV